MCLGVLLLIKTRVINEETRQTQLNDCLTGNVVYISLHEVNEHEMETDLHLAIRNKQIQ